MNPFSKFDESVWLAATDDYEAPHTIAGSLAHDLGRPVTEEEVLSALVRLARAGRVVAFELSPASPHAVKVAPADISSVAEPWFLAVRE